METPLQRNHAPIKLQKDITPTELVVKEILSTKNIKTKTIVTEGLSVALTRGTVFTKLFDSKVMGLLVSTTELYRISIKGEGRKGLTEMVRSLSNQMEIPEGDSLQKRLTGRL